MNFRATSFQFRSQVRREKVGIRHPVINDSHERTATALNESSLRHLSSGTDSERTHVLGETNDGVLRVELKEMVASQTFVGTRKEDRLTVCAIRAVQNVPSRRGSDV